MESFASEDYLKGLEEGMKHSQPSRETRQRFERLEDLVKDLPTKLASIEAFLKSHEQVHKDLRDMVQGGFAQSHTRHDVSNGRLKDNERKIALATGGLMVIALIAVPILTWALFTLVNLQATIQEQVRDVLVHYEFELIE